MTKDLRTELGARGGRGDRDRGAGSRRPERRGCCGRGSSAPSRRRTGPSARPPPPASSAFAAEERPRCSSGSSRDEGDRGRRRRASTRRLGARPALLSAVLAASSPRPDDVLERRAAAAIRAIPRRIADESVRAPRVVGARRGARPRQGPPRGRPPRAPRRQTLAAAPPPAPEPPPSEARKDGPAPAPVPPAPPVVSADVALAGPRARARAQRGGGARLRRRGARAHPHPEALDRAFTPPRGSRRTPRVRLQALRALPRAAGISEPARSRSRSRASRRTRPRRSASRRRCSSAREGPRRGLRGPSPGSPRRWPTRSGTVAAVAAVSVGKTSRPPPWSPLQRTTGKPTRTGGAAARAVVGLGHTWAAPRAVPPLIGRSRTRNGAVRRTAYEYLRRLTPSSMDERRLLAPWWAKVGATFELWDRAEGGAGGREGRLRPDPDRGLREVGTARLDIVCSRAGATTSRRCSRSSRSSTASPARRPSRRPTSTPSASSSDTARGGDPSPGRGRCSGSCASAATSSASCWALHHTVELVYPGLVQKLPTRGGGPRQRRRAAMPAESVFLEGVFTDFTRPVYVLYTARTDPGAPPERVEVLIDAPRPAQRWGGGKTSPAGSPRGTA